MEINIASANARIHELERDLYDERKHGLAVRAQLAAVSRDLHAARETLWLVLDACGGRVTLSEEAVTKFDAEHSVVVVESDAVNAGFTLRATRVQSDAKEKP